MRGLCARGMLGVVVPDSGWQSSARRTRLTRKLPTTEVPRAQRSPVHRISWLGHFPTPQSRRWCPSTGLPDVGSLRNPDFGVPPLRIRESGRPPSSLRPRHHPAFSTHTVQTPETAQRARKAGSRDR
ncbi:hypothetical protein MC885_005070 [Smutsia gigantea]|nr:hypothetical protein MC885_005070 [Smutsia gigantea]